MGKDPATMVFSLVAILVVAIVGFVLAPRVRFALKRTAKSESELKQFAKWTKPGQSFLLDDDLEYGFALSDRDVEGEFTFTRIDDSRIMAYRSK